MIAKQKKEQRKSRHKFQLRYLIILGASAVLAVPVGKAAPASRARWQAKTKAPATVPAASDQNMLKAKQLVAAQKYKEASILLFQMSRSPYYAKDVDQIKYILGLTLSEQRFFQSAAFVYYDLIREASQNKRLRGSRYVRMALQKLALAADQLDSDVLLKYAIKQIDEQDFPASHRDMLYYRKGELKQYEQHYDEAAQLFSRVGPASLFYAKAKYRQGLALAEAKQPDRAVAAFDELIDFTKSAPITDRNRVDAMLGRARSLYQAQKWDASLEAYRNIPRDTEQWHESLFEQSWADVRAARFRSALSDFQSLHSAFYDDFYQPESLLLRSIVYLYICRFDEMEKTLDLFNRIYKPIDTSIRNLMLAKPDSLSIFNEFVRIFNNFDNLKMDRAARKSSSIPFLIARKVLKEADVLHAFRYLQKLADEKKRLDAMPASWTSTAVGRYSIEVVRKRSQATQVLAGRMIQRHLVDILNELRNFFEQSDLLKFERLSGRKEALKKEIAGRGLVKSTIEEDTQRDVLIQNGYEYWPFKGEYWLDEIGNYYFLGTDACE